MYKKILVPVDGSDASNLGLKEALKLAMHEKAAVRVVHVVDELIITSATSFGGTYAGLMETLRLQGRNILDKAVSLASEAGITADSLLIEEMGSPAGPRIIDQAKEWPADLIVCGTHGRRGLRRLLMGSDAEYILRHAPTPVLLVRANEANL